MKREKVTYEEVAAACENLVQRGDQPSVRNVLQEVGGGGSQTIAGHLSLWRQNEAASEEAKEALASQHISGDMVQSLLREIARHKEQAVEGVKRQLSAAQDDVNALREELTVAQVETDDLRHQLEVTDGVLASVRGQMSSEAATGAALLGESRKQVAKLEQDLEQALSHLSQERVTLAQLRASVETYQARHHELVAVTKKSEETATRLRDEHRAMQQSKAEMQYAVFEAEKKSAVAVEQVNSRDAAIAKQDGAIAKLEESLQAAQRQQRESAEKQQVTADKLESAVRRADIAEARLHTLMQAREQHASKKVGETTDAEKSPN